MSLMREQVVSKWMGRKQAQEWVCSPEGMRHCYTMTQRQHSLSQGDFPDWRRLSETLREFDFNQLYPACTLVPLVPPSCLRDLPTISLRSPYGLPTISLRSPYDLPTISR
jgi:hypothetical protein